MKQDEITLIFKARNLWLIWKKIISFLTDVPYEYSRSHNSITLHTLRHARFGGLALDGKATTVDKQGQFTRIVCTTQLFASGHACSTFENWKVSSKRPISKSCTIPFATTSSALSKVALIRGHNSYKKRKFLLEAAVISQRVLRSQWRKNHTNLKPRINKTERGTLGVVISYRTRNRQKPLHIQLKSRSIRIVLTSKRDFAMLCSTRNVDL